MDYRPSTEFFKRVLLIILITIGGFYFLGDSSTKKISQNNAEDIGSVENQGGLLVFSKNDTSSGSLDMQQISDLNITGGEPVKIPDYQNIDPNTNTTQTNTAISTHTTSSFIKLNLNDLKIVSKEDTASLKKYADDLVLAIKPYSTPKLPNEAVITADAISSGDSTELAKVSTMSDLHKAVARSLLMMEIPISLGVEHLALLNNVVKIAYLDSIMANALDNQDGTILDTINEYKRESDGLIKSITAIDDFFYKKGIIFSKDQQINIYINGVR